MAARNSIGAHLRHMAARDSTCEHENEYEDLYDPDTTGVIERIHVDTVLEFETGRWRVTLSCNGRAILIARLFPKSEATVRRQLETAPDVN